MISIDTNLLFYAINSASPHHQAASDFLEKISPRDDIVISEFVLSEFYQLLRNATVLEHPLDNAEACSVVATYRQHPHWQIAGFPPDSQNLHDELWKQVGAQTVFARRRFFDLRIALILKSFGVKKFATTHTKDFQNLGFDDVWNPIESDRVL